MEKIHFIGENLWPGNLGQFFVVLACLSSLVSGYFYLRAANSELAFTQKLARRVFQIQAGSVFLIFVILFSIIFTHRYEYYYAWHHSSNSLPVYYMISCFWEGQEGSFLLWMFWNAVIGLVLMRTAKQFEAPVMAVLCLAQFALSTMLLGITIDFSQWFAAGQAFHIGSSPFELIRDARPDMFAGIPTAQGKAMYLKVLADGNGLNPLLQNYWMVIHPPTLFFGFAVTIVPFAYSIAGLWKGKDREWITPALNWSLICVGILGTGIIMGGFWAYESLSFGGYWAWDPVENASLMPWIIMAAATHLLLISRNTGRQLFTSHLLIQLSYWLVLYATFLTRSGILGDASVHSFTDLGLSGQLLVFLFVFIVISVLSLITNKKLRYLIISAFILIIISLMFASNTMAKETFSAFESNSKIFFMILFFGTVLAFFYLLYKRTITKMEDEKWNSRELWMFIGSMFLILSLVQVFSSTSIPVFNKLFGGTAAIPKAEYYNRVQVWLAMPIMLLMAIGQYFRYRETDVKVWVKNYTMAFVISLVLFIVLMFAFGIVEFKYGLFLFLGTLLVVANILYLRTQKRMEWLAYGASVAHAGFGILLIGVLVSSVNQKILSSTVSGIDLAPETDNKGRADKKGMDFNRENLILYLKKPVKMDEYDVTYLGYSKGTGADSIDKYFQVLFAKKDAKGNISDSFTLHPKTQNNAKMGLLAEPSTKHFWSKDIFTHVNYESSLDKAEPFSGFTTQKVALNQTFLTQSGKIKMTIDSLEKRESAEGMLLRFAITAVRLNEKAKLYPAILINLNENTADGIPSISDELGLYIKVTQINTPAEGKPASEATFTVETGEKTPAKQYIVLKAIEFPWIKLVWAGTIILLIGSMMAFSYRRKQQKALLQ